MPEKFWIAPQATSTTAATAARGTRTRTTPRTRSAQKLPSSPVRERANPRTSATATAMPTAAETKFCTARPAVRSEEHTSELQSRENLVCRLLLEKKKSKKQK